MSYHAFENMIPWICDAYYGGDAGHEMQAGMTAESYIFLADYAIDRSGRLSDLCDRLGINTIKFLRALGGLLARARCASGDDTQTDASYLPHLHSQTCLKYLVDEETDESCYEIDTNEALRSAVLLLESEMQDKAVPPPFPNTAIGIFHAILHAYMTESTEKGLRDSRAIFQLMKRLSNAIDTSYECENYSLAGIYSSSCLLYAIRLPARVSADEPASIDQMHTFMHIASPLMELWKAVELGVVREMEDFLERRLIMGGQMDRGEKLKDSIERLPAAIINQINRAHEVILDGVHAGGITAKDAERIANPLGIKWIKDRFDIMSADSIGDGSDIAKKRKRPRM